MGGPRKEIDFEEEDVCWWVWWVFSCNAMLCCWLAVGLIEEELVWEGREERHSIMKGKGRLFVEGKGIVRF